MTCRRLCHVAQGKTMDSIHLQVTIYSHHFSVERLTPRGRWLCTEFAKKHVQYGWESARGFNRRVMLRVYAAATEDRLSYRFHINCLADFKLFITERFITDDLIQYVHEPLQAGAPVEFKVFDKWKLRDDQLPAVEYLDKPEPMRKFVDLQTGFGKSIISLISMARYGRRICIVIKPTYIDKWVGDVMDAYDIDPKDVIVVQGSASLMALLQLAKEGALTAKVIIISNSTFRNWVTAYEKYSTGLLEMGYACLPHQYGQFLDIGVRLIDEAHQDWHFTFKLDVYTHVPKAISLSATLIHKDPFMNKTYELAYPMSERFTGVPLSKYINSYAVHYRFNKPEKIRTVEYGRTTYSHNAFEESVMANEKVLQNYLNLLDYIIQIGYNANEREKKKLLIFAKTIALCTIIKDFLKQKYPTTDVRRYTGDDPYCDLMDSQICVSTLGSSGTALDIPNLTNVILTVAISSAQGNIQGLGRLRNLKDGSKTEFHYLVCNDIKKHIDYDEEKKEMLEKRAKSFSRIHSGFVL